MNFVFPEFLYALSLLSIPVIIHLFNFRRFKKVAFTNVRFLKELKEETTSRSRIKHLLVLLSRLLAIACLVVAFAQPFIPVSKGSFTGGQNAVSIFIDNSFSMDAVGKEGVLMQEAISRAKEIAGSFQPGDRFQLLTNDFSGSQQRLLSREEFIDQLQQVRLCTFSHSLNEILMRQKDALINSGSQNTRSFIISDFQRSVYDLKTLKVDSTFKTTLIHLTSEQNKNVYIDTCFFSSPVIIPDQPCELTVRIRNTGENDESNIPLKLTINGVQKAVSSVTVVSGSVVELKLNFTISQIGWQRGEISINDYPITFDDKYYFSFSVETGQIVYVLNDNAVDDHFQRLFGNSAFFQLKQTSVNQVDYTTMQQSRLLVLNNLKSFSSGLISEIEKFVSKGGSIIIFPDSLFDRSAYNTLLASLNVDVYGNIVSGIDKLDKIDLQSDIFKSVFEKESDNINVPVVSKHFEIMLSNKSGREVLLKLQGGNPLLARYFSGKGKVYLFTIPLGGGFSDFSSNWLFAPTVYRIALLSKQSPAVSYTIGNNQSFPINENNIGGEEVYHLKNDALKFDIVPQSKPVNGGIEIFFSDQVKQAGNYELILRGKLIAVASMNYKRSESDLNCFTAAQLDDEIRSRSLYNFSLINSVEGNIAKQLNEKNEGIKLWKPFIIAALLFLLIEILLLKFLK